MKNNELVVRDNNIVGDFATGDMHKTTIYKSREQTAMSKVVERYLAETKVDRTLLEWTERLEHFLSNSASADIRSLEEKLKVSGREDLVASALVRKQAASKAIMRQQGSRSAQTILTYLMADIVVNFDQNVTPLVQDERPRSVVDAAILECVISPALRLLEENPLELNKLDVQSFMYYLAGNCYIRWDKC